MTADNKQNSEDPMDEARIAYARGDIATALRITQDHAEKGNASGQYNLGVLYSMGQGVKQDYKEAMKWYRKAADQGHAKAPANIGIFFLEGSGVTPDLHEAVMWFQKGAAQGDAIAQSNLARMYLNGSGVQQNLDEALKWYRKAAEDDQADAQYHLGLLYATGRGVNQNFDEAVDWYRKAAGQGHDEAQRSLDALYEEGKAKPPNDLAMVFYSERSAEQSRYLLDLSRNELVRSAIVEHVLEEKDVHTLQLLSSNPECNVPYLVQRLRGVLTGYHNSTGQRPHGILINHCFCYAFAKGAEHSYLRATYGGQFNFNAKDALRGAAGAQVSEAFADRITKGMGMVWDVYCDLQNNVMAKPGADFQGDPHWVPDLVGCAFFWAFYIGLTFGMKQVSVLRGAALEVFLKEARSQGWLKGDDLPIIPELAGIQRECVGDVLEMLQLMQSGDQEVLVHQSISYLFAKGVEGVLRWIPTPNGKISLSWDLGEVGGDIKTDLPAEQQKLIRDAQGIGKTLAVAHQKRLLKAQQEDLAMDLELEIATTLTYAFSFGIAYGINLMPKIPGRGGRRPEIAKNRDFSVADLEKAKEAFSRKDYAKAAQMFRALAENGQSAAQLMLGAMYAYGHGVPQDSVEALRWYRSAAEQGSGPAQLNLGAMYAKGKGVPQDYQEAAKWYRKAAEQGIPQAQHNLGGLYFAGDGVPQDDVEAVKWARKAAEQGDAEAQGILGVMYNEGRGVARDVSEAMKWYRKAADQGDAQAQYNLGLMYNSGDDVPEDHHEAMKWYLMAAQQGIPEAQFNLGAMYERAKGVSQDYAEAVKWYRKAAEQGFVSAQYNLAVMYAEGHGVMKDLVQAYMWFLLALSRVPDDLREHLINNREEFLKVMNSSQIKEAEVLARAWKPKTESKKPE